MWEYINMKKEIIDSKLKEIAEIIQLSDAGNTNERTEWKPRALFQPDHRLSAAACGASKVKESVCVCVYQK